ncbi:MAG: LysR family transcriptional regulator [Burkholderiales bacterium]|nr:LysR family transcriptional regulator [Burkholderiales bacterium]
MNNIDLRRFDLNLLVVFEVLMAEQSVTRAAARLSRTQSAVSHALMRLRAQVDDPLLVKVGGRMRPSPRAATLLEEVRPILAGIRRALASPEPFAAATSTRAFRVAIPDVSLSLFAEFAARVAREAPGTSLEWVSRDAGTLLAVAEGRIDLAMMPTALGLPEGVEGEAAGVLRWATFARRDHPALSAWGRRAWARWPHVVVRVGDAMPSPVDAVAPGAPARRVATWVPHFSAVAPLLAKSDCLATLPLIVMADALDRYALVALPTPFPIAPMPHRLVWGRRLSGEPGLVWLREHLRAAFGEVLAASEAMVAGRLRPPALRTAPERPIRRMKAG